MGATVMKFITVSRTNSQFDQTKFRPKGALPCCSITNHPSGGKATLRPLLSSISSPSAAVSDFEYSTQDRSRRNTGLALSAKTGTMKTAVVVVFVVRTEVSSHALSKGLASVFFLDYLCGVVMQAKGLVLSLHDTMFSGVFFWHA